jgi:hypothetical protein
MRNAKSAWPLSVSHVRNGRTLVAMQSGRSFVNTAYQRVFEEAFFKDFETKNQLWVYA